MSENISPSDESVSATQPTASNQDNASVAASSTPEAISKESTTEKSQTETPQSTKPAKKEPKQGVRDTRTNKGADAPEQAKAQSDDKQNAEKKGDKSSKDDDQSQQNNSNGNNNNRSRGRRGRKSNEQNQNQNQHKQAPLKVNPKLVAKKAWKIFLAEVGEEGLALIGDKEGKELTKRSFKLAELFEEETQRRVNQAKASKAKAKAQKKAQKDVKKITKETTEPDVKGDPESKSSKKSVKTKKIAKKAIKSEVVKKETPKKEASPELALESKPAEVASIDTDTVVKDSVSETPKVGAEETKPE